MPDLETQLRSTLRQSGHSSTASRLAVFRALAGQEPLTMAELADRCGSTLDRSSLYRTIELFEKLGIVQRLPIGWKYKLELSDAFQPHHHHLSCTGCGQITNLPEDKLIEERLQALAISHGYTASEHQVELKGLCTACQAKQ